MARTSLVLLLALPWLVPSAALGAEIRYTVELGGNPAGTATSRDAGARERHYTFEYNDRGRGSSVKQHTVLDERGVPVRVEITGHDYWKNPVDERYELQGGKASWRNPAESREGVAVSGPAYYPPMNGVPQDVEVLAAALQAAPGHKLPLLPAGEVRLDRLASREVAANGRREKVELFALSGLGFSPLYFWLGADGRLFVADQGWLQIYREGWGGVLPELKKVQEAEEGRLAKARAERLSHRPAGPLVFRNARLFDPESGKVSPGTTVVISGDRIQAVGPDGEVRIPEGAEVIDAAGRTLMPGLWDMHAHVGADDGLLNLAAGVTTVRDLANDTGFLLDLRRRIDAGEILGTRILMAGFLDGPGPYAGPTKVLVDTKEEALAAVDEYARLGYVQVKLYSSLDPALVPAIIERAHARGLRVSGHVPNGMSAEQAVRAGFDEIQHINFLFLNFFEGVDTRTPARFHAVGEKGAGLDLRSARVQAFLKLLREERTVVDPTLVAFEGMFNDRPGEVGRTFAAIADRLPPQVQRSLLAGGMAPAGKEELYARGYQAMKEMVRALHEQGVPLVAGTDNVAGFSLHRELELYVEAGLPPVDALRAATIVPAKVMKRAEELGTVAPGKLADVILVDGDPTQDIRDIRRVVLTVRGGVVYEPAKLYGEIGVKPAV